MGRSIDLYSYDYDKLVNKILEVCKTDDQKLVEKILGACGNKICDRYVILNQEMWDDSSCYYNVARVLEKIFKAEDVFGEVFCTFKLDDLDKEYLINSIYVDEVYEIIGIDPPEEE